MNKYTMEIKREKLTQENLKYIESYLKEKYGNIEPQWQVILYLLADNLDLYIRCKRKIDETGIYNLETGRKNPLIATLKDLQATILKQIQHIGISPYAASKIKLAEEESDDFIDTLTN